MCITGRSCTDANSIPQYRDADLGIVSSGLLKSAADSWVCPQHDHRRSDE
jgi:hypothetical protein